MDLVTPNKLCLEKSQCALYCQQAKKKTKSRWVFCLDVFLSHPCLDDCQWLCASTATFWAASALALTFQNKPLAWTPTQTRMPRTPGCRWARRLEQAGRNGPYLTAGLGLSWARTPLNHRQRVGPQTPHPHPPPSPTRCFQILGNEMGELWLCLAAAQQTHFWKKKKGGARQWSSTGAGIMNQQSSHIRI